jgi:hypothetical protein
MLDFFGAAVESDLPDEWKPRVTWLIDRCRKLEKVAEAARGVIERNAIHDPEYLCPNGGFDSELKYTLEALNSGEEK